MWKMARSMGELSVWGQWIISMKHWHGWKLVKTWLTFERRNTCREWCTRTHTNTHARTYAHTRNTHAHTHANTYIHVYIYTHTHIHTHALFTHVYHQAESNGTNDDVTENIHLTKTLGLYFVSRVSIAWCKTTPFDHLTKTLRLYLVSRVSSMVYNYNIWPPHKDTRPLPCVLRV